MRIQEDQLRRNNIVIDVIAESPKEKWKDTENKLHQMLYDYRRWCDNRKAAESSIITKLYNYKDKEYILKNAHHLKDTNIYIYEDFSKETMAIRKSLWDKIKKLRQQGKYGVIK